MIRRKDPHTILAKKEGFRARSIYKLQQINNRFDLIKKTDSVLDLGSFPGSWLQFLSKYTSGLILGIDLNQVSPIDNVKFIRADITKPEIIDQIKKINNKFDVVISDAAPKTTGILNIDHELSYDICKSTFNIAKHCLKKNGNYLCKMYQSDRTPEFVKEITPSFYSVRTFRPQTTKKRSNEVYIIAKGLKV